MAGNTEKLGRLLADLDRRIGDLETYPQLRYSSVDDFGVPVLDTEGTVVARLGKQTDGTWGAPPLAGPVPPEPKGVSAVGAAGGVEITWTGATVTGTIPLDFDAVEVLADDTVIGAIHDSSGGRIFVPLTEGTHRITARTRSTVPICSDAVTVDTITVGPSASQIGDELRASLATASKQNIVATEGPPALADGYPAGAFWTRVELINGALVARERWTVDDGTWSLVGLDASTIVTGTLDAGLVDAVALAARMVTSGLIRTGATGQRLEMTSDGLILYGVDPDGSEYEMVRIGPSGTQLLTIGGATIDPDGDLVAQDAQLRSLVVNGTSLGEIVSAGPRGVVGRGYRATVTEWRRTRTRVLEVPVTLEPGRTYRVSTSTIPLAGYSKPAVVRGFIEWAPLPVTTLGAFVVLSESAALTSASDRLAPMSRIITTDSATVAKGYSFIVRTECADDYHRVAASGTTPVELVVEDLGPAIRPTGAAWQDAAEVGTTSPAPVPTTSTQRLSLHRDATAVGTYRRGTPGVQSTTDAVQGVYGSYGNREGLWLFADMTSALAGATVEKVVLRFTITHTYAASGGIAEVRLHGNMAFPSGAAGLNTGVANVGVKAGGSYAVTLTDAATLAGFKSGAYRGFGLSTDSAAADRYVRGQYASIDITYTK